MTTESIPNNNPPSSASTSFSISEEQIQNLMRRFQGLVGDFRSFEEPSEQFKERELNYKHDLLATFQESRPEIEKDLSSGNVLTALDKLKGIINRTNLVGWRAWPKVLGDPIRERESLEVLREIFKTAPQKYEGRSTLEPIFEAAERNDVKLEWTLLSVLLWLLNPSEYFPIKISIMRKLASELGYKLQHAAPRADLYAELIDFGRSFHEALQPWNPSDWIDVQSFMWVVKAWEAKQKGEPRIWTFAPGEQARLWEFQYAAGEMAIGWDQLRDLRSYDTKQDIAEEIKIMEERPANPTNDALACWQFANELKPGD